MHAMKLSSILAALALSVAVVTAGASDTFAREHGSTSVKAVQKENEQIAKKTAGQATKNKKIGQAQKKEVKNEKKAGTISKKTAKAKKKTITQNTKQENKAVEKQSKQSKKANSAKLTGGQKFGRALKVGTFSTMHSVKTVNKGFRGISGVRRVEDQNAKGLIKTKEVIKTVNNPIASGAHKAVNKSNMSDRAKARTNTAINVASKAKAITKQVIRVAE